MTCPFSAQVALNYVLIMTAERISFYRFLFNDSSTQGVITSSLLEMEMHIPAVLDWHAKSNWVKLSQHIREAPRLFTIQTNSTVKNVWNWPWHVPQLPSSASYPISVSFVEAQAICLFWGYDINYPVTQKLWKLVASVQSIHLHNMYEREVSLCWVTVLLNILQWQDILIDSNSLTQNGIIMQDCFRVWESCIISNFGLYSHMALLRNKAVCSVWVVWREKVRELWCSEQTSVTGVLVS